MVRHAAALAIALCVSQASVQAQTAELTVNASSADVYKTPSVASVVIGHAPRGAVLEVTREVGDWVKVVWPDDRDGFGYVRLETGSLKHGSGATGVRSDVESTAARTLQAEAASPAMQGSAALQTRGPQPTQYVTAPMHTVGLGGVLTGSRLGFGVGARVWAHDRFGVQFEVSRYATTSPGAPERLTSTRIAPSLLYSLPDHVTDSVWLRPYVGAGLNMRRQSLNSTTSDAAQLATENKTGFRTFGGTELTFPSMPRIALSVDVGYDWPRSQFAGFDVGGLGFGVSAHWYVR